MVIIHGDFARGKRILIPNPHYPIIPKPFLSDVHLEFRRDILTASKTISTRRVFTFIPSTGIQKLMLRIVSSYPWLLLGNPSRG
jgi:hypothetical protein